MNIYLIKKQDTQTLYSSNRKYSILVCKQRCLLHLKICSVYLSTDYGLWCTSLPCCMQTAGKGQEALCLVKNNIFYIIHTEDILEGLKSKAIPVVVLHEHEEMRQCLSMNRIFHIIVIMFKITVLGVPSEVLTQGKSLNLKFVLNKKTQHVKCDI